MHSEFAPLKKVSTPRQFSYIFSLKTYWSPNSLAVNKKPVFRIHIAFEIEIVSKYLIFNSVTCNKDAFRSHMMPQKLKVQVQWPLQYYSLLLQFDKEKAYDIMLAFKRHFEDIALVCL